MSYPDFLGPPPPPSCQQESVEAEFDDYYYHEYEDDEEEDQEAEAEAEATEEEEIIEMAVHLGLKHITASDQLTDTQLWIIERAIEAPLPEGWTEYDDGEGRTYYHNLRMGKSLWDHPMDEQFRAMLKDDMRTVGRRNRKRDTGRLQAALDTALGKAPCAEEDSGGAGPSVMRQTISERKQRRIAQILGLDAAGAAEVGRIAEALGISISREPDLLWIAEQGLDAPLPAGWRNALPAEAKDAVSKGAVAPRRPVFVQDSNGAVTDEHPLFSELREMVAKMREESATTASSSKERRRRFSDSEGLDRSLDSSAGRGQSDCWSTDDEETCIESDEEDLVARRVEHGQGRHGKPSDASSNPGSHSEPVSAREPAAKAALGASFSLRSGLAGKLGTALQEASGVLKSQVSRTNSPRGATTSERPRSALPLGICSLGSLPKGRTNLTTRESPASADPRASRNPTSSASGLGAKLRQTLSLSARPSRRREDVYRVPNDYNYNPS